MLRDVILREVTPARQKSYRIPECLVPVLKDELDIMLSMGVIEPSLSEWCSPIVLFPKKDGTLRFCIDFRHLNSLFRTPFGLFQFRVMPFGLQGARVTFQRLMDQILQGTREFAAAYLGDVVIFSETWEEHCRHLRQVLGRINQLLGICDWRSRHSAAAGEDRGHSKLPTSHNQETGELFSGLVGMVSQVYT